MNDPVIPRRRRGERGFSLVEVMIASLIMLLVALAIIPLFTMATTSNLQGASSTSAANYARDRFELMWQLPFTGDPRLTITAGTTVKSYEYFNADPAVNAWVDLGVRTTPPAWPAAAVWRRVTTVRQFNVDDLSDAGALPFDANPEIITMKEVTVEVQNARSDAPFGGGKQITIRAYRAA